MRVLQPCSVYECGVLLLVYYIGDCSSRCVVRDHAILLTQDDVSRVWGSPSERGHFFVVVCVARVPLRMVRLWPWSTVGWV